MNEVKDQVANSYKTPSTNKVGIKTNEDFTHPQKAFGNFFLGY